MLGKKQKRVALVIRPSGETLPVEHPAGDGIEPFFLIVGAVKEEGGATTTNAAILAGGGGYPGMPQDGSNLVVLVSRSVMLDGLKGGGCAALNDAATLLTGYPVYGTVAVFATTKKGWGGLPPAVAKDVGGMARGMADLAEEYGSVMRVDCGQFGGGDAETLGALKERMKLCVSDDSRARALHQLTEDPNSKFTAKPTADDINRKIEDWKKGMTD